MQPEGKVSIDNVQALSYRDCSPETRKPPQSTRMGEEGKHLERKEHTKMTVSVQEKTEQGEGVKSAPKKYFLSPELILPQDQWNQFPQPDWLGLQLLRFFNQPWCCSPTLSGNNCYGYNQQEMWGHASLLSVQKKNSFPQTLWPPSPANLVGTAVTKYLSLPS